MTLMVSNDTCSRGTKDHRLRCIERRSLSREGGLLPSRHQNGMTPQAAAEKAFRRVEEIFAKYPIAAG